MNGATSREGRQAGVAGAAVALLLGVVPWLEGGASPSGLFVGQTLVCLILVLAVAWVRSQGALAVGMGWEAPATTALIAVFLVSLLGADYLYGPLLAFGDLLVAVALAGAVALLRDDRWWRLWAIVVAGSSVAQGFGALVLPEPPNMTQSVSFANANQLAAYLNVGAFVASGLAVEAWRSRSSRWLAAAAWGVVAVNTAALLRIGARGALASLTLVGALAILSWDRRDSRRLRSLVWLVPLLVALAATVAVARRFDRIGDPYRFDRIQLWRAGLEAAGEHPVLGLGPGMFERRSYRYAFPLDDEMFRFSKSPGSTHSTWIELLAETGPAGLVSGVAVAALVSVGLWKRFRSLAGRDRPLAAGVAMACYATLVQGLVDTPLEVPAVALSLIALSVPMLTSRDPRQARLFVALGARTARLPIPAGAILAGLIVFAWVGGVLRPYWAWVDAGRGRLDRAIAFDGYNPRYRLSRAESVWRRDRPLDPRVFAAADIDLWEAHRLDPGIPEYLMRLAQLHARACFEITADPAAVARAEGLYRSALALGVKDPRPRLELATFLLAQGRAIEGIDQIRAALVLEPRYLTARLALVKALIEEGNSKEASIERERLGRQREELAGYQPRNGYESDLIRLDPGMMEWVDTRLR